MNNTQRTKRKSEIRMNLREVLDEFFFLCLNLEDKRKVLYGSFLESPELQYKDEFRRKIWQSKTLIEKLELLIMFLKN